MVDSPSPTVVIGLDEPYVRAILDRLFKGQLEGWTVKSLAPTHERDPDTPVSVTPTAGPLLLWLEYEDLDWDLIFNSTPSRPVLANAYCIRKGLIRKAQMAFNIHKYVAKNPDSILTRAVPATFIFELDHPDYLDEALNENFEIDQALTQNAQLREAQGTGVETESAGKAGSEIQRFILKPSLTGRGAGIHLFDTREGLEEILESYFEDDSDDEEVEDEDTWSVDQGTQIREWVVQAYVDRPLLLAGGRKFHIRAYVLALGAVEVFLWRDMLCLFAPHRYTLDDLTDHGVHLTNTCLQTDRPEFDESRAVYSFWDDLPTLTNAQGEQALTREALEAAFDQMKAVLHDLFDAVMSETTTFQARQNCFELFGFDFLLDERYGVHLLEANAFPDFKQTGTRLQPVVEGLFEASAQLVARQLERYQSGGTEPLPEEAIPPKLHRVFNKALLGRSAGIPSFP
ncbi:tubulin--tyrosine ligase [Tieghemiomyces parasiticus]|uniref:Tubulin--tyrosine ligase n=1 Tax=Tieghemiomyces parasiticus TaxID=78921 RepID=A0A9W8A667_9FUNG|nr:tubulin--tyrosine ligase [Tieghemiomyces parasiticus]